MNNKKMILAMLIFFGCGVAKSIMSRKDYLEMRAAVIAKERKDLLNKIDELLAEANVAGSINTKVMQDQRNKVADAIQKTKLFEQKFAQIKQKTAQIKQELAKIRELDEGEVDIKSRLQAVALEVTALQRETEAWEAEKDRVVTETDRVVTEARKQIKKYTLEKVNTYLAELGKPIMTDQEADHYWLEDLQKIELELDNELKAAAQALEAEKSKKENAQKPFAGIKAEAKGTITALGE